jgi:hypothetical protein
MTRPRAVPLLPSSLLTPRVTPSGLQLPSLTPRRHGVLAHACLPRGPVQRHPPCPAHHLDDGVRTKRLPPLTCPSRRPLLPHCTLRCVSRRSLCCCAELSTPSLSPCAGPRYPTECAGIKGTCPMHFVHASGSAIHQSWNTHPPRSSSPRHGRLPRPPRSSSPRHGRSTRSPRSNSPRHGWSTRSPGSSSTRHG